MLTMAEGTTAVFVVRAASMPMKNMPPPKNALIRKVAMSAGVVFFMGTSFLLAGFLSGRVFSLQGLF
jgi:hypothetical protein